MFSNKKHEYIDFEEAICEYRYNYTCNNPGCSLHNVYFNPASLNVLPRKGFSLAMWKWIAKEHLIHDQKPRQIVARIKDEFDVSISESTIRRYINEIEVYVAGNIDAKTLEIVRAQGQILLAFDGQNPDNDGPALWLFVDMISNRVLRIVLLEKADHLTLHEQVEEILSIYGVTMVGMISDKQGSIVKMHDTFYPEIPHQYCHFHFLQNMWNHLELRDGHIQKELSKVINHLYITSTSSTTTKILENGEKMKINDIFGEVEKVLKKLVKTRSKKFERLRGIEACKKIEAYVADIEKKCKNEDQSRYVVKWLLKTVAIIRDKLKSLKTMNDEHIALNQRFQEIRALLGDPKLTKAEKNSLLDCICRAIWDKSSKKAGVAREEDLRTFQPKLSTTKDEMLLEWTRLYWSYRRGLFAYYDFPLAERTNSPMEGKFSEEKAKLRSRIGKKDVAMHVRIRGSVILKGLYAGKVEIKSIINEIDQETAFEQVKAGLEELAERTRYETSKWGSMLDGDDAIQRVLDKGR